MTDRDRGARHAESSQLTLDHDREVEHSVDAYYLYRDRCIYSNDVIHHMNFVTDFGMIASCPHPPCTSALEGWDPEK